ncbi:hypothetical protein [Streptomyces sp. AcE210]|uniref:hypothetical protein n=1 Tax=Streptomyces sp. AcE210 TaxID=2292703 RepID=UPI000E308A07|nr:hypothetical protein [Streptomyces sp. AcE210]RFC75027.1 hypothetical protein DXZ75_18520 [Streptomyces sp. AcE210]
MKQPTAMQRRTAHTFNQQTTHRTAGFIYFLVRLGADREQLRCHDLYEEHHELATPTGVAYVL